MPRLGELPIGGTAVGTGLNAPAGFGADVVRRLAKRTGLPLAEASDHIAAQASAILAADVHLVSLGGDHFVTWPLLQAHAAMHGPLALVQLTVVTPFGKTGPEAGTQVTPPQVPLVVGSG